MKLWILLGCIPLALLAALLILLCTRAWVDFDGKNGEISLKVGYGLIRFRLLPRKRGRKAAKPEKKEKKPAASPFSLEKLDVGEAVDLVLYLLDQLRGVLRVQVFRLSVTVATANAALTGLLYGQIWAAAGMITPFLEDTFGTPDLQITLDANFDSTKTRWAFQFHASARPIAVLRVFLRSRKRITAFLNQIAPDKAKKEKEKKP